MIIVVEKNKVGEGVRNFGDEVVVLNGVLLGMWCWVEMLGKWILDKVF